MGIIGSLVDLTPGWRGHQVKPSKRLDLHSHGRYEHGYRRRWPPACSTGMWRSAARPIAEGRGGQTVRQDVPPHTFRGTRTPAITAQVDDRSRAQLGQAFKTRTVRFKRHDRRDR